MFIKHIYIRYSLEKLPGIIDAIHNGTHHEVKTMCTCRADEVDA